MMKVLPLYLFLTAWVLFGAGCGGEEPAATPAAPADTVIAAQAPPDTAATSDAGVILVLGNSLAAGYGLDEEEAFPALLQDRIDSLGLPYRVVNAGLSGATTAGGLRRLDWFLKQPVDILVIELGGNDGLRGTPLDETRRNLQAIIDRARDAYPGVRIVLAGMQIPPNLGHAYTTAFRELYPELAEANDVALIPFLMEGVGGNPALMQEDGLHPTAEGQRIMAANVWAVLSPLLETAPLPEE